MSSMCQALGYPSHEALGYPFPRTACNRNGGVHLESQHVGGRVRIRNSASLLATQHDASMGYMNPVSKTKNIPVENKTAQITTKWTIRKKISVPSRKKKGSDDFRGLRKE